MTSGRRSRSFGGFCNVVSTGIDFGSLCSPGVSVPGVEGGVKAGLRSVAGGGDSDLPLLRSKSVIGLADRGRGE